MRLSDSTRKSYAARRTYGKAAWRQIGQAVRSYSIRADFRVARPDWKHDFPKARKQIPYRLLEKFLK